MKVVVDTNVPVSGIFFRGVPGHLVESQLHGRIELVLSPGILEEYRRAGTELAAKYPERAEALAPILTLIAVHATMVDATPLAARVSADPADDMFLAAARDGDALLIVSGDRHLLDVTGWQGVEVITPSTFADRHVRGR